jgi:hypothetical protein
MSREIAETRRTILFTWLAWATMITVNALANIRQNRGVAFRTHLLALCKLNHGFCQRVKPKCHCPAAGRR